MRTCNAEGIMLPAIGPSLRRRSSTIFLAIAIAVATLAVHPVAIADDEHEGGDRDQHWVATWATSPATHFVYVPPVATQCWRSEEHTSELQSLAYLVCRLLLEKKKKQLIII